MKKFIKLLTLVIFTLSVVLSASGCFVLHVKEPEEEEVVVEHETEYTFNETHHWYEPLKAGGNVKDYAEHVNPKTGASVGRCVCGYYFPCHNLVYTKKTINGVLGYEVIDYDEDMSPQFYHVEVPKFYQAEGDAEPLPVISVGQYALSASSSGKCEVPLKSIKLNEGLLNIGNYAFASSDISEIVVPDSVVGTLHYTFMQCTSLEKIVVGNGVTSIGGYTFYGIPKCETIILGDSVQSIAMRTFINCAGLTTLVLPASLISIAEDIHKMNDDAGWGVESALLPGTNINVYFKLSREDMLARTIPLFPRDDDGNVLNEDGSILFDVTIMYNDDGTVFNYVQNGHTTYGLTQNWAGANTVYCLNEWYYDVNGNPVPFEGGGNVDDGDEDLGGDDDGIFDGDEPLQ